MVQPLHMRETSNHRGASMVSGAVSGLVSTGFSRKRLGRPRARQSFTNDVASRRKMRQRGEEISGEEISGGGNTTRVLCSCVSPFVISSTVNAWRCERTSSSEVSTLSQEDSERASHSETWRPGLKGIIYLTCKNATQSSEAYRQRAATVVSLARARCPVL